MCMYFLGDQFSENKAKILSGTCHFLCLRFLNIDFVQTLDPSGETAHIGSLFSTSRQSEPERDVGLLPDWG